MLLNRQSDVSVLDHCIWNSLSTRHSGFAEGDDFAKRYPPAVTLLAAIRDLSPASLDSLGRVMAPGETCALFLDTLPALPAELELMRAVPLVQMVWSGMVEAQDENRIEPLSIANVDEMLALTELTKPGPFGERTPELGTYLGIRENGRLVAMAGE